MTLPKGVFIETGKELNDRTFDENGNNIRPYMDELYYVTTDDGQELSDGFVTKAAAEAEVMRIVQEGAMHVSYDYTDLLEELEHDINEGLINQDGDLLVARSEQAIQGENGPYHPIVDYYAVDFEEDITKEIRELEEDPSRAHSQELENLLKADRKLLRFYNKDKKAGRLEKKSVNDIIVEMNDWNRIIR